MNANIKGTLQNFEKNWKYFIHNGKLMEKDDVKKVLEYGLKKGYEHTGEISDEEINNLINQSKQ